MQGTRTHAEIIDEAASAGEKRGILDARYRLADPCPSRTGIGHRPAGAVESPNSASLPSVSVQVNQPLRTGAILPGLTTYQSVSIPPLTPHKMLVSSPLSRLLGGRWRGMSSAKWIDVELRDVTQLAHELRIIGESPTLNLQHHRSILDP